jgi:hypothetical protein
MLETYELLDRFELLYPNNSKLSDLRRSYIDQDLSSIFRLLPEKVHGDIEDLRKSIMDKNLHSIFRLVDDDDLRKLILEDNTWKLWPIFNRYVKTEFVSAFKNFFVNDIKYNKDCFSRGQLQSKIWLINELKRLNINLGTVFICAGWYATLAVMLFESGIQIDKIRSFDLDPSTVDIADTFNKPWFTNNWQFKSLVDDIFNIDYSEHTWQSWSKSNNRMSYPITDIPDTIINTSCEHIKDFSKWYNKIPNGKLIILQSNDYFKIKEHVNCSKNLSEFSKLSPMKTTLFEGEFFLPEYTRFMKIGFK